MKRFYFAMITIIMVVAAFNLRSIDAKAEILVPSGKYVSIFHLKDGDVFYKESDSEPLIYRVIKAKKKKNDPIEIEILGLDPNPDRVDYFGEKYDADKYINIRYDSSDLEDWGPYRVVGIADNAFKGDTNIRSFFTFGGSYFRYIGKSAFEGCANFQDFSDNRKGLTTIKSRAFCDCPLLDNIYLTDDSLEKVGKDAFKNTSQTIRVITYNMSTKKASKINKLFKKAGANDIYFKMDTPKKEKVKTKIPNESDYVKKLPKGATFSDDYYSYRVLKSASKNKRGEVEVTGFSPSPRYPEMSWVDPWEYVDDIGYECYDIVGIADNAFKGNQKIKSVSTDNKIRYVGKSAFEDCTGIEDVYFFHAKNLSTIKARAFCGCTSLKKMWLRENNLKKVGKDAFLDTPSKIEIEVDKIGAKKITKIKQLFRNAGVRKLIITKPYHL
ncbi:leucine-rich repeat protein [Butyrivibrio sp. WCD2001]|uniref:leucine-rich repeat protein n=1 Tax=Butyrivibrio sp. WCD2001 TaxID=1280681 RepID=UPI0003F6426E|nr:leucine-rich repeat protein [Butyrivibrio sp. WCD2001]